MQAEWDAAGPRYAPTGFATEGFIHCSYASQVAATAARHYAGRTDVVLLEIDPGVLDSPVVAQISPATGESFPHIHGQIPRGAVVAVHDVTAWTAGTHG
ncbi:MAG TPA: DUF952 domain-containing protein [Acidimicrobiales bacterium]|nr:DUF952 domain-containing protein [Acidimicrobiales bacterium]